MSHGGQFRPPISKGLVHYSALYRAHTKIGSRWGARVALSGGRVTLVGMTAPENGNGTEGTEETADAAPSTDGTVDAAGGTDASAGTEGLSTRDRALLALERRSWASPGAKERAIREELGLSPVRYYQLVNALIEDRRALEADPVTVNRLRRVRDAKRSRR